MTGAAAYETIPGVTVHARDRLLEHYGITAPKADWLAAVAAILDRTALLVRSLRARDGKHVTGEVYAVTLAGMAVEVAWRPCGAQITTVMPPNSRSLQTRRFRERRTQRGRPHMDEARRVFAHIDGSDDA